MDSKNSALKRHFNFPSIDLDKISTKDDWEWIYNGSCLSNADRKSFELLNEEAGEFKNLKECMHNYEDVIYANRDYTKSNETRHVYCEHIMNHLKKCRNTMRKNNDRISEKGNKIKGIRDQGFHRCRVMIILPTRNSALEVVKCLRTFMEKKHKVSKKYMKFISSFEENGDDDDDSNDSEKYSDDEEEVELTNDQKLMQEINNNMQMSKSKHVVKKRGIDFDEWTEGNNSERFLFGVAIDKKLFSVCSQLAQSDIIIGSPLSIKEMLDDKSKYLNQLCITSSIEMTIVDQAEYMFMQNFDNLYACFEKLNQIPRGGSECIRVMNSTLRIRQWALDQCGEKYRQNIIVSAILHPFLRKIMSACQNFQGTSIFVPVPHYTTNDLLLMAARLSKEYNTPPTAKKVKVTNDAISFTRLLFSSPVPEECKDIEVTSTTILDIPPNDSRSSTFRRKVLPILINQLTTGGVLIYFTMTNDLYQVQQMMKAENMSVAAVTENVEDANPIITLFAKGAIRFLLLSERFYALTRMRFSALRHIVYFSTPTFPKFARDFHEFMMHNSRATIANPHTVINICEEEVLEQVNSQLAFSVLYGQ